MLSSSTWLGTTVLDSAHIEDDSCCRHLTQVVTLLIAFQSHLNMKRTMAILRILLFLSPFLPSSLHPFILPPFLPFFQQTLNE